ncbi:MULTISPECIES: chorismate mutase [unclassified Roseitalea]|uniref:chorismate mutase n=1 Tax=unclassified Roseitalea TaxID=2639107 RepID=UPI00273EA46D|nr:MULTISPECIES: chorismate mutase [unclassified Roseitalea]
MERDNPQRLTELRAKIDAVDETIHTLIMQRATVIDELIRIKGADRSRGAAFRPGREAQMMRALADRHAGSVPLGMIVHLWRELISTFTHMQAPYAVHLAEAGRADIMRDMARHHFGFTVPLIAHADASGAIAAARARGNALALVPLEGAGPWWDDLDAATGLSVMARLPVIGVPFATVDAFVLSPQLSDPVPFDVRLYTGLAKHPETLSAWTGGTVIATGDTTQRALIAIEAGGSAPHDLLDIRAAGGYFAPAGTTDPTR